MTYEARNAVTLNGVHPSLRYKLIQLLDLLRLNGEDVLLYEGFRTIDQQNADWQVGRDIDGRVIGTTITDAKGGYSFHNYGLAVDFAPVGPLGVPLSKRNMLEWSAKARYEAIARLAQTLGLEWGGTWPKPDKPHLQYADGLSITAVRSGKRPDAEKAKAGLTAYYRNRITNAKRGLKHADADRTKELDAFIVDLQTKLNAL
ncbi:MAG: ycdD [Schlesneria sp.]|nr:ycdD [Schlesneria sp.]